jgi:hypothetical protein
VGQDIHFYVEQRTADGWQRVEAVLTTPDGRSTCERCRQPGVLVDGLFHHERSGERACRRRPDQLGMPRRETWLGWRSHLMFAILGSYCGPSRHLTFYDYSVDDDGVEPVAPPRGLPVDVSDEVRCAAESWGIGGHAHSHLTVRELLGYDWDRTTRHVGMMRSQDPGRAQRTQTFLDRFGGPSWDWACANGVVDVEVPEAEYQELTWTEAYWRNVPHQFFGTVLRMARLAGDDLDSVRCVFWFDN